MTEGIGQTIGVVGGGIVGLAVARELTRRRPGTRVVVLEKEEQLARHQTGHNSGVVHAGIYYRPGSLKAELCTRGRSLLREYCAERAIPYEECGKLVVAVDRSELGRLDTLERTATENGVPGLRRVEGAGITEVEPYAAGLVALHSPQTAITDYVAVAHAYADDVRAAGGEVRTGTEVTGIRRTASGVEVATTQGPLRVDRLVVCAGLYADRVSQWADGSAGPRIVPFRGEYMSVRPAKADLVRGMVYPVPDPRYPFLGVHFTRRVGGGLEVGPNAVLALAREGYRRRDARLEDLREFAAWPGFWRLAATHWRTGARELRGSLSVRAYMAVASRYVPQIGAADVVRAGAGVRAQAVERDGSLLDDFRVLGDEAVTTVRNAPSPAATSSLAIAEHVVDRMGL
ncbi:L-2-hydroxyglutarate oxidase [Nocardioides sp. zg-DK7169]|uniref:L-2-hydroxyglutarate oxidase n=1 Tax=Nocardioides sp. zg-DK7169 TaxID=2736600 RepID=UPI0015559F27|nr:L-2-hydroxyglutarate oxidase [Nocardioides sp. zg-DK7169]NPC97232.1 L-2-hydroxyglutarate oxidase [Nocardioides sp. zg-DK7169]